MLSDDDGADDAATELSGQVHQHVVQCCPFCGEPLGVFWGRRLDDGSHWCEPCGLSFSVVIT